MAANLSKHAHAHNLQALLEEVAGTATVVAAVIEKGSVGTYDLGHAHVNDQSKDLYHEDMEVIRELIAKRGHLITTGYFRYVEGKSFTVVYGISLAAGRAGQIASAINKFAQENL